MFVININSMNNGSLYFLYEQLLCYFWFFLFFFIFAESLENSFREIEIFAL